MVNQGPREFTVVVTSEETQEERYQRELRYQASRAGVKGDLPEA